MCLAFTLVLYCKHLITAQLLCSQTSWAVRLLWSLFGMLPFCHEHCCYKVRKYCCCVVVWQLDPSVFQLLWFCAFNLYQSFRLGWSHSQYNRPLEHNSYISSPAVPASLSVSVCAWLQDCMCALQPEQQQWQLLLQSILFELLCPTASSLPERSLCCSSQLWV